MLKVIEGDNFSGRSFYLKCFAKYPSEEVLKTVRTGRELERDNRLSLYLQAIPEYNFSGLFDQVYYELFKFRRNSNIPQDVLRLIQLLEFDLLYYQKPGDLSGGEKSLLTILSNVIENPKILSIDNTLEQLDSANKRLLISCLNDLSIPDIILSDNRLNELDSHLYQLESFAKIQEPIEENLTLHKMDASEFVPFEMMGHQSLEVSKLSFSYGNRIIFKDFSFTLKSGKLYHLNGKNGSGKSTLSKLLCGILKPEGDSLFFLNGKSIKPYQKPGMSVGYSSQQPDEQLFSTNVKAELGLTKDRTDFRFGLAKTFGLHGVLDQHPFDLPLTLRKRLSIAATLAVDRPVYIIDEPTLYLDNSTLGELRKLIHQILNSNRIVVIISHSNSFISGFENILTIKL